MIGSFTFRNAHSYSDVDSYINKYMLLCQAVKNLLVNASRRKLNTCAIDLYVELCINVFQ